MKTFLRRFALVVLGVLSGFDRVVFKGRLPQLYSPEGMNCYAAANHVRLLDFKQHAKEVTRQVLAASLVESAKAAGRFQYLNSGQASKEEAARTIWKRYLEALSSVAATTTVAELLTPWRRASPNRGTAAESCAR